MEKCKVIVKKIGAPAEETLLENTYEAKKELVGGAISYIDHPLHPDIQIVMNREGIQQHLPATVFFDEIDFVIPGNCVFITHNEEGEMISLSDEQTKMLLEDLKDREFDDDSISVAEAFWAMKQAKQFKKDMNME
ncbi:MAG: DUF3846 domain-containing protein [Clostridia bacterium]|nr:DUF3846 domain-containing protein [Clostridia bacterium]MBQ7043010.1 DUF3846 domain-containing protein [Clostridia bacterium]MBQ9749212.1 DUF3846 domain-containing protein [Clostridia bacterium]